jgi:septum formation protein
MLVLASASPRRSELLRQAGLVFEVEAASIDETPRDNEDAIQLATRLAREKAEAVFNSRLTSSAPGSPIVVLGADTVVLAGGEMLGKPQNANDACRMLGLLSGCTHQVITGVALVRGETSSVRIEVAAELTHVTMRTLSQAEISRYVSSGEPADKAGAYAIQGYAARWIPRIQGCYFNVVGLPLALVLNMLEANLPLDPK